MLDYRSLKDMVYDHISAEIASGTLKPNAEISESHICAALQISRTPVREALMQLSHEGYIEHIQRRGFFTRGLTIAKVRNIFEILGNLESAAAISALDSGNLDLPALRAIAAKMEEALSTVALEQYNKLQISFHDTINRASGNEDMVKIISNYKKFFMREEYLSQTPESEVPFLLTKMNEEHWHIVHLLEAGDREGLRTFIRDEHWNPKYAVFHEYE